MSDKFSWIVKYKQLILSVICVFYVIFVTTQLFALINKTYIIDESKLYKIDSVSLMSKAFGLIGSGRKGFEFDDEKGFNYTVSGESFFSITNKELVKDTFRYYTLLLTVYTDKTGIDTYIKGLKSRTIEVFQFSIGNTKYIDIDSQNNRIPKGRIGSLLFFAVLFILVFISLKRGIQVS